MSLPGFFDALSDEHRETVAKLLTEVEFAPGTTIFTEGDEGDAAYFIDEGDVRIELELPEVDTESVLRYEGPGSTLGEVALLDRLPRSATAVADTHVRARTITTASIDELAVREPGAALALTLELARDATAKLRTLTNQVSDLMFATAPDPVVDDLVDRAVAAQTAFADWPEDRVDALLGKLTAVFLEHAPALAQATVEETHIGNVDDKTLKNMVAAQGVYDSLVGQVGAGTISTDEKTQVTEIAAAAGVVFGLVPVTNPVATAYFKTLVCLKSRNAVILSFHHAVLGVGNQVGELIRGVLEAEGAPADIVLWVKKRGSRKLTQQFMSHPGVSLILATGGSAMVQAAYSSGTPALGVGPGNAPTWIAADADLPAAASSVVMSKSFDNGVICGAEHNLVVDRAVREEFIAQLEASGAAVLSPEEAETFMKAAVDPATNRFQGVTVGQSAATIAGFTGIARPYDIKVIVVPASWDGEDDPLAAEKMTPILSLFDVEGDDEAIALSLRLLAFMGTGHTSIIHSQDPDRVARFGAAMPTSRILANSPGAHGVFGVTTGLTPSLTLGCGTFGGNSTTDNVTFKNLRNIKRLARLVQPGAGDADHPG
ncbi:aldehyde dehydrogenase family protein [Nocardioides humilatus]|uniref:Aldehyde dehydrogenase family protein n=1 Tax=Nocardioides humilatus TaxID=2607660 RepID=A0A5B1L8D4_9ACTN|nr:aldehyde dehydrogenase family protein [Nocardioides humilatus]KAA1415947.1 aldehyde dehydrogenase family protein [Nocardioides humilatus]